MNCSVFKNSIGLVILLIPLFFNSCGEPCDGDSFYESTSVGFKIIDPTTGEDFFNNSNPDYQQGDFRLLEIDTTGEEHEYDLDFLPLFPNYDNDNTGKERSRSLVIPITKYYFLRFNDYDEDTLKIIIKGTHTVPCSYEVIEYYKVYFNGKLVFYDLAPHNVKKDDANISLYKSI